MSEMSETPRLNHAPIPMTRKPKDLVNPGEFNIGVDGLNARGDFYWDLRGGEARRTLILAIPKLKNGKDDGEEWQYSRWNIGHPNSGGHQWTWDGNEDAPTLSPSLHAVGIWHGFVKQGKLIES